MPNPVLTVSAISSAVGADEPGDLPARLRQHGEQLPVGQLVRRGAAAVELVQHQPGPLRQRADAGVVQVDGVRGPGEFGGAEEVHVVTARPCPSRDLGYQIRWEPRTGLHRRGFTARGARFLQIRRRTIGRTLRRQPQPGQASEPGPTLHPGTQRRRPQGARPHRCVPGPRGARAGAEPGGGLEHRLADRRRLGRRGAAAPDGGRARGRCAGGTSSRSPTPTSRSAA